MSNPLVRLIETAGNPRVLVVGDMLELGPRSQELHSQLGQSMAKAGVDLLIGVGSLGGQIAFGAAQAGLTSRQMADVDQASKELPGLLKAGDLVLIKGSRGMAMEHVVAAIREKFGG